MEYYACTHQFSISKHRHNNHHTLTKNVVNQDIKHRHIQNNLKTQMLNRINKVPNK